VIFAARKEIHAIRMMEVVENYIVALVAATRRPTAFGDKLKDWIAIGASPRGTLALDCTSRVLDPRPRLRHTRRCPGGCA
jgi:MoxR-like ATPase